jgi:hypothetical protein
MRMANQSPIITCSNVQYADNCAVVTIVLSKETTELVTGYFSDLYTFVKGLETDGLPDNGDESAFKFMEVLTPTDMSFQLKLKGGGGACKSKEFFCHCCDVNDNVPYHNLFHSVGVGNRCVIC